MQGFQKLDKGITVLHHFPPNDLKKHEEIILTILMQGLIHNIGHTEIPKHMWTRKLNNCEIVSVGAEVHKLLKIFFIGTVEVDKYCQI